MSSIKINYEDIDPEMDLEVIPIKFHHLVINPDKRIYVVLEDDNETQAGVEINQYEASMISFVQKGLHLNSHINTIHQLFIKALQLSQVKIEEIVIESKVGDVIYCTLKMIDAKNNRAFNILSLADGIILSRITNCPLKSLANVWDNFDEIDEWDYEDYIVDIDPDED